jgi:ribosome-binding factor A
MRPASEFDSDGNGRIRTRQVSSLLSRVIQDRLSRGIADPRMRGMVSVTSVEPSSDLRSAVVMVSVLPGEYGKRVLMALQSARGLFQRQIKKETSLKHVPALIFRLDDSIKRDAEIARAVRECEPPDSQDENGPDSSGHEST